ncbi:regulatory protein RecX [Vallitalea guaymasensis]|uniref:Regulatory protein RecX n=1 Tax=Vallitalea guaymasensis TaxID=1185412 RepID=A0A8J8MEV9_9FIRM|nr:regulatory protein RecX [Vallitalea guaymasensis]QUH31829.1 regulatory protein RecX [Vallitalea guaymasensis]
MIITNIIQNKRFKNYYDIYIDDEYLFFVTYKELKFLKLKENDLLSEEILHKIYRDYVYPRAKNRAFRLLQRRDMPKKEIIKKLKETGYNQYIINKVIEFLEEYNFIDDRKYTEKYINYNKTKKSLKQINIELIRKGISKDIVEEFADYTEICEEDIAYNLIYKKYKNLDTIDNKIKRRMISYLMRKGYNYGLISKVINQFIQNEKLTNT